MATINDMQNKTSAELVNEYLDNLNKLMEEHDTSISKTRDNLLNCIEANKRSNINSTKRCKKAIAELDEKIKAIAPFYTKENEKVQEKNEARILNNNNAIASFSQEQKENIVEINRQYDEVVNEENDKLDNLQYLNRKELQQYIQGIDAEEYAQTKELENAIEGINREIDSLQKGLIQDIDNLKHDYLIKASEYNEQMRKTRNEFIEKEKDLRGISREETSSHHKQIEELTKAIIANQKVIINNFSQDLIKLSNDGDQILIDNANDQIKLLSEQANNKIDKRVLEIEKDYNIRVEKEKQETKIRNLKILKLDLDNKNTTRINRENVYSLMRISEYERDSLLCDAIKDNKISGMSLDANAKINLLHEQLNDKKNDLDFFKKRFDLLKASKIKIIELYSHLYDVTATLYLDLNQLERESVLEHQSVILKKRQEDTKYLNLVSEYESNKEIANNNLNAELETIELEIKKINTSFDNSVFKTRSSYNTEKTRIEHIFQLFETKYNTELKALDYDINFIISISSKIKDELLRTTSKIIEETKKERDNKEKIPAFCKMVDAEIAFIKEEIETYFIDKSLRFTPDVDEIINDYIDSSIQKKKAFENEFRELNHKMALIESEIKDIENDLYILEANKKSFIDKSKKAYDEKFEIKDFDEQIDEKSFRLHILRLRQKSQAKDLTTLENEMAKIDEGKEILSKKENKKLYELEFINNYYNKYEDLQDIINNAFKELSAELEICMKDNELKSLYKFSTSSIKIINKAINEANQFHSIVIEEYKNEFKKIAKACDNGLDKEKKQFDINLDIINKERMIAIDDEESRKVLLKKNAKKYEIKADDDIHRLKEKSDELLASYDSDLDYYDRMYGLKVAALNSNADSMKKYYDDAITNENKRRTIELAGLYRQRKENKLNHEINIARLHSNYQIDMEKFHNQAKNRISNVIRQYDLKSRDLDNQLKSLDDALKKSSNECNSSIIDSNFQLSDFIKKLDNTKQSDIKRAKDEITKKLKHDIKKYKIELETKNSAE